MTSHVIPSAVDVVNVYKLYGCHAHAVMLYQVYGVKLYKVFYLKVYDFFPPHFMDCWWAGLGRCWARSPCPLRARVRC